MNKDYYIKLSAKIDDSQKTVTELNSQIKSLEKKVAHLQLKVDSKKIKTANKDLNQLNKTARQGKDDANKWQYSWTKAFQSFTTYMSVTTVFYQTINTIKDMINEVVELDDALVELRKVTDLEGESLQKFTQDAYDAAEAVAKTGTEMVQAATEFAKAGYSEEEILKLGELALMYTNIADEEVSAAESAEFMIAQMKAFNIEAKDAVHIIDAVNEVANRFAVSSADIANNLGKSSAVMANAGNSYEQMIGLLTAGTEITRNASKVANGLKTITLRLQGMNDDGEENLELTAQMEAMFKKLGLSLYKADGSLKNTYEILQDLAPVYRKATAAEKAYITETIAGKYQAQNAAAILNNFETALKATETALNSEGSAAAENAKVMESITGKLNNLKSEFEELSNKLINSELIKFVVDLGTALLKFANSDVGQFIIKTTLLVGGIALLHKGFTVLSLKIKQFNIDLAASYLILQGYNANVAKTVAANATLSTSFSIMGKTALASLKSMGLAFIKFMATPAGIAVGAIALLAGAITLHNKKIQDHIDNMEKMNEAYAEESESIKEDINSFKKYKEILDSSTATEEEKNNAKKELLEIQNQLANKYDTEADKLDLVNGKYEEQLKLLNDIEKKKSEDYIKDNYDDIDTAKKYLNSKVHYGIKTTKVAHADDYEKYPEYEKFLEETVADGQLKTREQWINFYDEQIKKLEEYGAQWGLTKEEIEKTAAVITETKNKIANDEQYKKSQETYQNYIEAEIQSGEKWSDTYYKIKEQQAKYAEAVAKGDKEGEQKALEELSKLQDKLKGQTFNMNDKDYKEQVAQYNYMVHMFDDYRDEIKKHNFMDDYFDTTNWGADSEYKKDVEDLIDDIKTDLGKDKITTDDFFDADGNALEDFKALAEENGFTVEEFVAALIELGVVSEGVNYTIGNFAGKMESWGKAMDEIQTKCQDLMGIMDEYNETGYISIDSLQKLLEKDWEYLQYLEIENGQLRLNTEALKAEAAAKLDEAEATAYADAIQAIKLLKTQNETEVNKHLATSYENLKTKIDNLHGSYNTLITDEATLNAIRGANGEDGVTAYNNIQKELETKLKLINSARANLNKNFSSAVGYSGSKSSSSSSKSEKEWWEEELKKLKDQFKYNEITIEEYINGLDGLLGRVQKGSDAWREINEELQKQRLTKVEDDYKRGTISLDEYIKRLKELIKAYKQGTDAWNELADKIKKGLQDKADAQKDDYDTAAEAAVGIIEDEIEKLEQLRDEQEEYYDQLIADKEKANEETERELELARLQEALANAKAEKTKRVWREGIGWVWEADQEAIREAQEALDEFNNEEEIRAIEEQKEQAISAIEEQIDAWEKYKESWGSVADDYETQQARITLANQLGADAEAQILQQRLDVLEKYKQGYLATMKEIADLENTPADKLSGYDTPTTTTSSSAPTTQTSNNKTYTVRSGDTLSGIGSKYGVSWKKIYDANKSVIGNNPNRIYPGQTLTIPGYANGGMVDYTGLAMLHGSKSKPEFVLNNDQMRNMLSSLTRPQTTSNLPTGGGAVTNYNFGNIELPNVTNARQFVTELKSLVNITKHQ